MITKRQSLSEAVLIDEHNVNTGIVLKEHKSIYNSFYWHKIIVENATNFTRDFVLRTLMNTVYPCDFIPVSYTKVDDSRVSFLLKNCGGAISEFCRLNLIIPYPDPTKFLPPFKLSVLLKHAHATDVKSDIQQNVTQILRKRYTVANKTLNLESFYKDPEIIEFCPLSQPKLLYFVLHLSREFDVEVLKLGNNEIEILKPLEVMCNEKYRKKLNTLDLRKNNIKSQEQLHILKSFPITEIYLDENPLCNNYVEHEYIKMMRDYCPKIIKLDGCRVPLPGMLSLRRNFLCTPIAQDLVDQFLEHYFTLYDSQDRSLLEGMYHKCAMFSMTSQFITGQLTSSNTRVSDYKRYSRNIKQISDFSKSDELLFVGASNILKLLTYLPICEHDPYTFTVDVPYHTDKTTILTITGVFKEPGQNLLDVDFLYGFTRTFVLMATFNQEYSIVNEQFHIFNATDTHHARAFKVVKVLKSNYIHVPSPRTQIDKKEMVEGFMHITHLQPDWAKKCLEECEYDLKRALGLFVNLFKVEKLPPHAFNFKDDCKQGETSKAEQNVFSTETIYQENLQNPPVSNKDDRMVTTDTRNTELSGSKSPPPIKDAILLEALNLQDNVSKAEAKYKLERAAEKVLETYTYCVKYYRILGKVYYKHGLFLEARKFLSTAMKRVPTPMGEEIFSGFTLFEIQYGDLNVAMGMVDETVESYPIHKTTKLLSAHIAKINTEFASSRPHPVEVLPCSKSNDISSSASNTNQIANKIKRSRLRNKNSNLITIPKSIAPIWNNDLDSREMFTKSIKSSATPEDKKDALATAFKEFESIYGSTPKPMEDQRPDDEESYVTQHIDDEPEEIITLNDSDDEEPMQVAPIPVQENKEESGDKYVCSFEEFRLALLKLAGIYVEKPNDEVLAIERHTGPIQQLMSIGEKVLNRNKNNFAVVRTICYTFWNRGLYKKVRQILSNSKDSLDKALLNNLIIHFKIKVDINNKNESALFNKVGAHVKVADLVQMINFFEDLMQDRSEMTRRIFEACLRNPSILISKLKILCLQFKTFALDINDNSTIISANLFTNKYADQMFLFHLDDISNPVLKKEIQDRLIVVKKNLILTEVNKIMEEKESTLEVAIIASTILYEQGVEAHVREFKNKTLKIFKNDDWRKYILAIVQLEYKYGDRNIGKNMLLKLVGFKDPCYYCLMIEFNIAEKAFKTARDIFLVMTKDLYKIMNPDLQHLLYRYHQCWMENYNVDILDEKYSQL